MEYPNIYYQQLAHMVIPHTSLRLKNGEVCFYEGSARSFETKTTTKKSKPKNHFGIIWTPWVVGVKNKKTQEVTTETRTDYYKGTFYITNMRLVFKCAVDAFDVMIPQVKSVKQYNNGIKVIVGRKEYNVMANVSEVLHVMELLNKAQDPRYNTPDSKVCDSYSSYTPSSGESFRQPIDETLAGILKQHIIENPGVIQSSLYKDIPEYTRDDISSALYWWEHDGKIRREKSGRSYALYNNSL